VRDGALNLNRKHLVQSKEVSDFEFLLAQRVWCDKPLSALLERLKLARYDRELTNWKLDEKACRDFVLSPQISPA
jgi:hypothetical protein